eukprot:jgi/Chlat1/7193/Chrsp57S06756
MLEAVAAGREVLTARGLQAVKPDGLTAPGLLRRSPRRRSRPAARATAEGAVATGSSNSGTRSVRFRPCIDIHDGKVKQIVGSTLRDLPQEESANEGPLVENYVSELSAGEYAKMYQQDNLPGGHVIMLGSTVPNQAAALDAITSYPGGMQVGGGITPGNAALYLDAGASHVIVTSFVFTAGKLDHERLSQLVETVGKKRLVLDLSCRKQDGQYYVVTDRWQRFTDVTLSGETFQQLAGCADEFLVHGVDKEGLKSQNRLGVDDELIELLAKLSPIPVTYAGGVASLDDLERVRVAGNGIVDVSVGSALDIFGGNLQYAEVVAWHRRQSRAQVPV